MLAGSISVEVRSSSWISPRLVFGVVKCDSGYEREGQLALWRLYIKILESGGQGNLEACEHIQIAKHLTLVLMFGSKFGFEESEDREGSFL